jgi:hypothetical protein
VAGLGVSAGLALQLQQLSLAGGDLAPVAAAAGPLSVAVTAGYPAAAAAAAGVTGLHRDYLAAPGSQMFAGGCQQQQQQQQGMLHVGVLHLAAQQHAASPVSASSGHLAGVAGPLSIEQQQLLLHGQLGQACLPSSMIAVTAAPAPAALCGLPLQQQQFSGSMSLQQQFLQPGQGFVEACWHA